jgi:hypothetical protein
LFGIANTVLFELSGKQMVIRRQGRMHSRHSPVWPSVRWWTRRLAHHGFAPLSTAAPDGLHRGQGLYIGQAIKE